MAEIAQELGITKQYVSLVLNEVGLGGKPVRDTPFIKIQDRSDDNEQVRATIAQLQTQGNYTLADSLRVMLERRARANELWKANRQAKRKPI
ncbi:MAG TPA: hypothetical protein VNI02_11670 [Blastocatellia bacterium]|nr:hypothetical protein [Blastocatellia bacterium]